MTMRKVGQIDGMIMKHFKEWYPGQYDGKLVSKIAKDYLKQQKRFYK